MRKIAALPVLLLFAPAVLSAAEPQVTIENIHPQPAVPGDTVKISILAQNQGTSEATFGPIRTVTGKNVELLGQTAMNTSFTLCGGCQKTGMFYFKVSGDAVSGSRPVEFHLSSQDMGVVENAILDIDGQPDLMTTVEGLEVKQGKGEEFVLQLENIGTDNALQTTAELQHEHASFKPTKIHFGEIAPGETVNSTVIINTTDEIQSGPRQIKVDLAYRDGSRNLESTSTVTASVLEDSEITVSGVEAEDAAIGKPSRILVELENLGPGEASSLVSKLSCQRARVLYSKNFVGSLDAEESVPMVYTVIPEAKDVSCDIEVSYTDATGERMKESFDIRASRNNAGVLLLAAAATAILAGAYYWKRRESG